MRGCRWALFLAAAVPLKVRDKIGKGDVGWYEHPAGAVAGAATAKALERDGIEVDDE
jgi:hypothetical protein